VSEPAELTDVQRRVMRLLFNSAEPLWALALARSTGIPYGTVYDTFRVLYDRGWAVGDTEINIKGTGRPARVLYRLTETGRTEAAKILGDG
jgi:predicted ArsR family transcriptional regulator